ncbi:MAG TPA: transposase, partial [Candidatus Deferrimicrobium sp.]|nr:transposase [Candidatus Deferrimicrobium sp.]
IKSSVRQAGISEQTYYQWKRAVAPKLESGELKDLVALEEENTRLKGLFAERLRKENAELKRKLGLDQYQDSVIRTHMPNLAGR